jgi:transposase InsO family protein
MEYNLEEGLIKIDGRIWVGQNPGLQHKILTALHTSAVGGHSGVAVTYRRARTLFSWPGLKKQVQQFVENCAICKQAKPERVRYPGLLEPLPVPPHTWHTVTMDFIEGLPKSSGYNCIVVVVDKLSRYAHFIPLAHPFTALQVAQAYMLNVYKLHGLPVAIVSDRDKVFTSSLWRELFHLSQTQLRMSSAYHPQTDGQTERVNQCLETYLRCFAHACPTKWNAWLHLAEFWYNTSPHSVLGKTPFEVLYGNAPRHFGIIDPASCPVSELSEWLQDREDTMALLQQHLRRAQQQMKLTADKKRSERVFAVGDWVYLKLQPYVQRSLATRANPKLAFRYFGPFQVLLRVGGTSYKLQLPDSCEIHPVIHVSQLRRAVPPSTEVLQDLPVDVAVQPEPTKVLETRLYQRGGETRTQVLIQWTDQPATLATWEDQSELLHHFPNAAAWGQATSQPGGNVTTQPSPTSTTSAQEDGPSRAEPTRRSKRLKRPNPRYT